MTSSREAAHTSQENTRAVPSKEEVAIKPSGDISTVVMLSACATTPPR
jgi:hypothetical protein